MSDQDIPKLAGRGAALLLIGCLAGAVANSAFASRAGFLASFGSSPAKAAESDRNGDCSPELTAANAEIVRSTATIKPGSGGFESIMSPDYIQHNAEIVRFAEVNGMSIRDAMAVMEKYGPALTGRQRRRLEPLPGQPADDRTYRIVAQCDMVVAVGQHWLPVPDDPGKFYASYFFNMWRIEDGKLVEHWDPDTLPSPLPRHLKVPMDQLDLPDPSTLAPVPGA